MSHVPPIQQLQDHELRVCDFEANIKPKIKQQTTLCFLENLGFHYRKELFLKMKSMTYKWL